MDRIEYREAVLRDENVLVGLWWKMQESHHDYEPEWFADKGEDECKTSWRERFRSLLQDENSVVIVATSSGTPVGMIVANFSDRPPIFRIRHSVTIATTVVHPNFRRKGLFRGMLQLLEDKARVQGITVLQLSVHKDNPAKHAYEKAGFTTRTQGMIKWLR